MEPMTAGKLKLKNSIHPIRQEASLHRPEYRPHPISINQLIDKALIPIVSQLIVQGHLERKGRKPDENR